MPGQVADRAAAKTTKLNLRRTLKMEYPLCLGKWQIEQPPRQPN